MENMSKNKDKGTTEGSSMLVDLKVWKEALVGEMRWMMRGELEQLHERLDQVKMHDKYVGGRGFRLEMKLMTTTGMIMT